MNSFCALTVFVLVSSISCTHCSEEDDLLKILELSHCPFQVEPIGCYKDVFGFKKRALPETLMNSRDTTSLVYQAPSIQWKNYHHWTANFICKCAKILFEKKPEATTEYIGVQFYAECWGNLDKYLPAQYDRYGKSAKCIDTSFKNLTADNPNGYGLYAGQQLTNYVYKVSRFYRSCPEMEGEYTSDANSDDALLIKMKDTIISGVFGEKDQIEIQQNVHGRLHDGCKGEITMDGKTYGAVYKPESCKLILKGGGLSFTKRICKESILCPYYESRGCWKDPFPRALPSDRPMNTYALNERDPHAKNWNGLFINWKKWGQGYLADLLCRCAKIAKQTNKRFFSIQFYGECWTSDKEDFKKYGQVTRCMDTKFKTCPKKDNMFRTNPCAGEWEANKVYEITQGIYKCSSCPCFNDGECVSNGPEKYKCICKPGSSGPNCEEREQRGTVIDIEVTK